MEVRLDAIVAITAEKLRRMPLGDPLRAQAMEPISTKRLKSRAGEAKSWQHSSEEILTEAVFETRRNGAITFSPPIKLD